MRACVRAAARCKAVHVRATGGLEQSAQGDPNRSARTLDTFSAPLVPGQSLRPPIRGRSCVVGVLLGGQVR